MEITWVRIIIILVAGFVSGVMNTLAGGGSFIGLAALDLTGLSSIMANGSNRVAILAQDIVAVAGFRSKGLSSFRASLHFAIPALFGSILGAVIVVNMREDVFQRVLGVVMLVMFVILILNPKKWLEGRPVEMTLTRRLLSYLVFFGVGIYGGAIQAGIGILMIVSLVLTAGLDLVKANVHKVFIGGVYTIFALGVFALQGQVHWGLGLVLAVGNGVGAWFSSRLAATKGQVVVRWALGVALVVLSVRYLGLTQYLGLNF
jgi:hypothetical protein